MISGAGTIAAERVVLGIDLAYKSWADIGAAILMFTPRAAPVWTSGRTSAIAWPADALNADTVAEAIDRAARETSAGAVSIDGPQGWRDPRAVDRAGVGRLCEYEAHTPGKTGVFGVAYPRSYTAWIQFSIAVFDALLVRPHVHLVNSLERRVLAPLPAGHYYLLECFPTSTWRTSSLTPLPGHRKAPPAVVQSYAEVLRRRFALPESTITPHHDQLQALVAALPAAALIGGPCSAVPRGEAARTLPASETIPAHRVEGLIWDAMSYPHPGIHP